MLPLHKSVFKHLRLCEALKLEIVFRRVDQRCHGSQPYYFAADYTRAIAFSLNANKLKYTV